VADPELINVASCLLVRSATEGEMLLMLERQSAEPQHVLMAPPHHQPLWQSYTKARQITPPRHGS